MGMKAKASTNGDSRSRDVRRGLHLVYATAAYNLVEAGIAIAAGMAAGSVALVGFGVDSGIELMASVAAIWRLQRDADPTRRERTERVSLRVIGVSFLLLATYVVFEATDTLRTGASPDTSLIGIGLAALSVIVMPALARAKRRVAHRLQTGSVAAEATQTLLCAYLSAILLAGLVLNAWLGWWWADPIAALAMVPIIVREGIDGVRGQSSCSCPPDLTTIT